MKKQPNYQKLILEELREIHLLIARSLPQDQGAVLKNDEYITLHMTSEMTPQYLFNECKKLFPIYSLIDLSKVISERKGNYTVSFKNSQEPDEENKNKSANDLKAEGNPGITLEERLLLEIEYFKKTGKNLDVKNYTLCSASRFRDGDVPHVGFNPVGCEVYVFEWSPGACVGSFLLARSAVLDKK